MTTKALNRIRAYHHPQVAHTCAICGRTLRNGNWLYSRYTGNRYCAEDKACRKRAERRSR